MAARSLPRWRPGGRPVGAAPPENFLSLVDGADREELGLPLVLRGDGDAVVAGPAGGAIAVARAADRRQQAVEREVGQAVGPDEAADLLGAVARGDQLAAGRGGE